MDLESFLLAGSVLGNMYQMYLGNKKTSSETDHNRADTELLKEREIDKTLSNLTIALEASNKLCEDLRNEFDAYKIKNEADKKKYENETKKMSTAFTRAINIACDSTCKNKHLSKETIEKIIGDAKIITD